MKSLFAPILAITLAVTASTAHAGGPVIVEEEVEVVAEPTSSVGILPILIVTVALCAALCGGGDRGDVRPTSE